MLVYFFPSYPLLRDRKSNLAHGHSINSIDKARLSDEGYSDQNVTWKAKLVLFLGFALMAGGLAGSATVLVIKYIVPQYEFPTLYLGVANVVANGLVMLR